MQALETSRLTRYAVKLLFIIIAFWILLWPHLRRPEALLLSGKEAYYHLQNGPVATILSFLNAQTSVDPFLLAKLLPIMLGIISLLLFYGVLRKSGFSYDIIIISTLTLIISPSFIYLFGTLNAYAFTSFLLLLALYLMTQKKEMLSILVLYLMPLFGIVQALLGLLLILIYFPKNKKLKMFLIALPSLALLYFSPKILPGYNTIIISDFGGRYGLGLFIILLATFGLKHLWQKKYKHMLTYATILLLCLFSFIDIRVLAYLNFILAVIAALGLVALIKSEWRSGLIKQLSVLIMIYGLIFSGLSYINFLSQDPPNQEVLEMIEYLKIIPDGRVFSQASRESWIEYSGKSFTTDNDLFYTRSINQALEIINTKKIKYLWIDQEMEEKIWGDEDQGLLFLLKYSKNFKKNRINNYVTLWEVVPEEEQDKIK